MQRRGVLLSIDGKSETKSREMPGLFPFPPETVVTPSRVIGTDGGADPHMARQALRQAWSPVSLTSTLSSLLTSRGQSQSSEEPSGALHSRTLERSCRLTRNKLLPASSCLVTSALRFNIYRAGSLGIPVGT